MNIYKYSIAFLMSTFCVLPMYAHAIEQACVSLLVGAGYAAKMRVVSGSFQTNWTGSFPIGQTRCQKLDSVPIGNEFTVEVHAILGKTKECTPSIVHSAGQGSITFQAWGTTLNVKCKMPSQGAVHLSETGHEPNKDGVKAKSTLSQ